MPQRSRMTCFVARSTIGSGGYCDRRVRCVSCAMLFRRRATSPRHYNLEREYALSGNTRSSSTYELLLRMEAASEEAARLYQHGWKHHAWPMIFRRRLRRLFAEQDFRWNHFEVATVHCYMLTCPPAMIPVCVWIISRLGVAPNLVELMSLRRSLSPQRRRHLAKALRRLKAWAALRQLAAENPNDDQIQRIATAPPSLRTFAERLKNFTSAVDKSHAEEVHTPSQMDFWAVDRGWQRSPPKSVELIRRILRHIQQLVHWHPN
jgi:hypothetical protein